MAHASAADQIALYVPYKEDIERRHGEPFKFLFLSKMEPFDFVFCLLGGPKPFVLELAVHFSYLGYHSQGCLSETPFSTLPSSTIQL